MLVILLSLRQTPNAGDANGVVALGTFNLQRAKGIGRTGVVGDVDLRLVGVCIYIGQAGVYACQRVAAFLQLFEAAALGTAPCRLRELLAHLQRPVFFNLQALRGA